MTKPTEYVSTAGRARIHGVKTKALRLIPDERGFPGTPGRELDVEAMRTALGHATGEHDFAGFARPGEQRGTVRTLLRADLERASWAPLWRLPFALP